jgi:NADH-ubiquinone oxidoreductase-F iron-sulfur binding region
MTGAITFTVDGREVESRASKERATPALCRGRELRPVHVPPVGCEKAVKLMQRDAWDEALLEELCRAMADASICVLGRAAPNPIRSAVKFFPDEVGIARTGKPIRDNPIKRWSHGQALPGADPSSTSLVSLFICEHIA